MVSSTCVTGPKRKGTNKNENEENQGEKKFQFVCPELLIVLLLHTFQDNIALKRVHSPHAMTYSD